MPKIELVGLFMSLKNAVKLPSHDTLSLVFNIILTLWIF